MSLQPHILLNFFADFLTKMVVSVVSAGMLFAPLAGACAGVHADMHYDGPHGGHANMAASSASHMDHDMDFDHRGHDSGADHSRNANHPDEGCDGCLFCAGIPVSLSMLGESLSAPPGRHATALEFGRESLSNRIPVNFLLRPPI